MAGERNGWRIEDDQGDKVSNKFACTLCSFFFFFFFYFIFFLADNKCLSFWCSLCEKVKSIFVIINDFWDYLRLYRLFWFSLVHFRDVSIICCTVPCLHLANGVKVKVFYYVRYALHAWHTAWCLLTSWVFHHNTRDCSQRNPINHVTHCPADVFHAAGNYGTTNANISLVFPLYFRLALPTRTHIYILSEEL